MKKHRKIKSRMEKNEKSSRTKVIFVSVVSIVVLIIAVLLLVYVQPVGKATYYTTDEGIAATFGGDLGEKTITLYINTAEVEFNSVYLQLGFGNGLDICENLDTVNSKLVGWGFAEYKCENGILEFGDATVNPSLWKKGEQAVAELVYTITLPPEISLGFEEIDAYSKVGEDIFAFQEGKPVYISLSLKEVPVAVETSTVAPVVSSSSSSSSGGGSSGSSSLACERKWSCGEWTKCNQGQQTRICTDLNKCSTPKKVGGRSFPVTMVGPEKPSEAQSCDGGVQEVEKTIELVKGLEKMVPPAVEQPSSPGSQIYLWIIPGVLVLGLIGWMVWYLSERKKTVPPMK